MTENEKKRRKLLFEILLFVGICFALSLVLYVFLVTVGSLLIQEYCLTNDIYLDEFEWYHVDNIIRSVGFAVSALSFMILFFALFGERLAYVRKITAGVDAIRGGNYGNQVELRGNNELTELAEAINYLSESEQRIKEKEKRLNAEKEELIRTLSHDIRTPLTSIMSYTELLCKQETVTEEEQRAYLALVAKKTAQIKELTDILLDGGRRELEFFEDARLLFAQLADEFESELEDTFDLAVSSSEVPAFAGSFDVGELRRIFDNLMTNIRKYADPAEKVTLSVSGAQESLVIRQSNAVRKGGPPAESYRMGLNSIRRIAQNYGGEVVVTETAAWFEITVTLSDF